MMGNLNRACSTVEAYVALGRRNKASLAVVQAPVDDSAICIIISFFFLGKARRGEAREGRQRVRHCSVPTVTGEGLRAEWMEMSFGTAQGSERGMAGWRLASPSFLGW